MEIKTERKRTLTLNLSEAEMAMLAALADHQGMSKSAVLRQALRAYRDYFMTCPNFASPGPPWYGARCRKPAGHSGECDVGTLEEAKRDFYAASGLR